MNAIKDLTKAKFGARVSCPVLNCHLSLWVEKYFQAFATVTPFNASNSIIRVATWQRTLPQNVFPFAPPPSQKLNFSPSKDRMPYPSEKF